MTDATVAISLEDIASAVRVRLAFDQGRATAIAKARARQAPRAAAIRHELDRDLVAQLPAHGRATRIATRVGLPRRTVARIVAALLSEAILDQP